MITMKSDREDLQSTRVGAVNCHAVSCGTSVSDVVRRVIFEVMFQAFESQQHRRGT